MDRAALRRFTGETGDQLMLWELLPTAGDPGELDPDDLHRVDAVLAAMAPRAGEPDPKLERLREILEDGAVSLVFVARQETVRHLRGGLGRGTAWCTGNRAGLDACAVPRATVLDWFREGPGALTGERAGARHLVVTDVAAEGLDLQRAGRVVHYDLPWTPMRMDQRDGRALRLGSRHARVDIVRFALPPALERALRLETAIRRKRGLPAAVGLGAGGRRLWRWRTELAESLGGDGGEEGVSVVRAGPRGALAGFGLYGLTLAGSARVAFVVGWLDPAGRWTEDEEVMAARLTAAAQSPDGTAEPGAMQAALEQLATPIRERLAAMRERRWARTECHAAARAVAARLQGAVREAARRRDLAALDPLDRALAFVAGGHTAGETLLLERLAQAGDAELLRAASRFPAPTPSWGTVEARLSSVVLFLGE
jgi:hypothetical protein